MISTTFQSATILLREGLEAMLVIAALAAYIQKAGMQHRLRELYVGSVVAIAASFFAAKGIKQGDRVILFSHNMPEWGMTYFGVLKAGATAIPIDPASSMDEIVNFAKKGEASAVVISPKLAAENPDLNEKLVEALERQHLAGRCRPPRGTGPSARPGRTGRPAPGRRPPRAALLPVIGPGPASGAGRPAPGRATRPPSPPGRRVRGAATARSRPA